MKITKRYVVIAIRVVISARKRALKETNQPDIPEL